MSGIQSVLRGTDAIESADVLIFYSPISQFRGSRIVFDLTN